MQDQLAVNFIIKDDPLTLGKYERNIFSNLIYQIEMYKEIY